MSVKWVGASGNFLVCRSVLICGLMNLIKSADPPTSAADFFLKKKCQIFNKRSSAKNFKKKIQNIMKFTIAIIMPILLINVIVFSKKKINNIIRLRNIVINCK